MRTPSLSSLLLASTDPDRLRKWYEVAFNARADPDGFVPFGPLAVLFDERDDVLPATVEPGRVVLNLEVSNIKTVARHLDSIGVEWVAPVEYREDGGAWFGTVTDPDGNYVQLIELTHEYWMKRRERHHGAVERARTAQRRAHRRRDSPRRTSPAPAAGTRRNSGWNRRRNGSVE